MLLWKALMLRHGFWPAVGLLAGGLRCPSVGIAGLARYATGPRQPLALLPSWQEYQKSGSTGQPSLDGLRFKRVRLRDRSISDELRKADAHGVSVLPRSGHLVVAEQEVTWQLRPPPALRALYTTGTCKEEHYLQMLRELVGLLNFRAVSGAVRGVDGKDMRAATHGLQQCQAPPAVCELGAIAVLLLGAGRAALGLLRGLDQSGSDLQEHKVIKTYAVRGSEKKGTGRFQLFEDAKKRGRGCKSEGAKLRRQNAIRFFEKINAKFAEWGSELQRLRKEEPELSQGLCRAWPPSVVFFSGDLRLRRLLLDCKNPRCPLPDVSQALDAPERWNMSLISRREVFGSKSLDPTVTWIRAWRPCSAQHDSCVLGKSPRNQVKSRTRRTKPR
ncbi:unnamed protein product [Durusdinium trenchii]|uniref:VLRF1 domain-containing protein n=1 Tax=Durusdinium trenchii TaxID=1381693 RepID=A0ABP0T0A1_9DINO